MLLFFVLNAILCVSATVQVPYEANRIQKVKLPMRDGVQLNTVILFPRASKDQTNKFATVIDRSPYGYFDLEWLADLVVPFGYVGIGQDMRGTAESEGNFTMWISDKDDSQDLGDWIVSQEWSNGKVMTLGASADGIGGLQTIFNQPKWQSAQYTIWATPEMYKILFPYGTYKQKTAEDWLLGIDMPNPDVVNDNIQTVHENEMHSDFWSQIELGPDQYKLIDYPSGFWAGWYDIFQVGTLRAYDGYNTLSDPSVRSTSVITVDPVGHCLEGGMYFTQDGILGRTAVVIAQLYETFGILQNSPRDRMIKNVTFYVMSSNDEAVSSKSFHIGIIHHIHLRSIHTLGGNNLPDSIGGTIPCGPMDQVEADARSDVIKFQTDILLEELVLTGSLMATLYVSSDAIDTDFTVKISDVYPTGEVRIIQDNAVRMRWREGTSEPLYMKKGTIYPITFDLWNTSYIFAPGHALRVSVSSSNFPRFSVNPNNGLLIADEKYPGENITAHNTIYHSVRYPSRVTLPVVNKHQLPVVRVVKEIQRMYPELTDEVLIKAGESLNKMITRRSSKK